MANNVPISAGQGTNIATDDVSGVHYQVVKLADGTEDSASRVTAGAPADAVANPATALDNRCFLMIYNGVNWYRVTSPAIVGDSSQLLGGLATALWAVGGTNTYDRVRVANVFKDIPATSVTAGTPVAVWTPASGKRVRLMGWALSSTVNTSIIFKYGVSNTTIFRTPLIPANSHIISPNLGNGVLVPNANDVLKLDVVSSATVAGFVYGMEE